jgi:ABC-type sugar transport system ATPase subunit
MSPPRPALIEAVGITKSFGSSRALRGIDFRLNAGEVHALLGPNGAGKSTFIKILDGLYAPDAGSVATRARNEDGPARIRFVHQDLGLVDMLSIRDNLQLGHGGLTRRFALLDHRRERAAARTSLQRVGLDVDADTTLGELSLGEKSLVAVARLLDNDADVLVLDEVTAALTRAESDWLLGEAKSFADAGGAVLTVTHRLREVVEHCTSVTVIRDGSVAYTGAAPSLSELHEHTSGTAWRPPSTMTKRAPRRADERPLLIADSARTSRAGAVDLTVERGEVIALVGPLSSKLYHVGHLLAGKDKLTSGVLEVSARAGAGAGKLGFLPEDRAHARLAGLEVSVNLTIAAVRDGAARAGWIGRQAEAGLVDQGMRMLGVQPDDPHLKIEALSGGNQQKAFIARASLMNPDVVVLCEPTHGVDVQTRAVVHSFIRECADDGMGVVIVTLDIDDALAVSDRVGVVRDGGVSNLVPIGDVSAEWLLAEAS